MACLVIGDSEFSSDRQWGGACFIHGIQCLQDLVGARLRTPNAKAFILNPAPTLLNPSPCSAVGLLAQPVSKNSGPGLSKTIQQGILVRAFVAAVPRRCKQIIGL